MSSDLPIGESNNDLGSIADESSLPTFIPSDSQILKEFVWFMLPAYFYVVIAFIKLRRIKRNEDILNDNLFHNSYIVKRVLCITYSGIYASQVFFAMTQQVEVDWVAAVQSMSLLYFFGSIAWYLALRLLEEQAKRGLPQTLLSHRLFWIAEFVVTCIKISNTIEVKHWPLFINILKMIVGLYLTLYSIALPFDSQEAEANLTEPVITLCLRRCLLGLEHQYERRVTIIEEVDDKKVSLIHSRKNTENEAYVNEFKAFLHKHNPNGKTVTELTENIKEEHLPPISCQISKDVIAKTVDEDTVKIFYEIKTEIQGQVYTKLHKYANFLDLEDYIERHCDPAKFVSFDKEPPEIAKVYLDDYPDEETFIKARIQSLDDYLNALLIDPRYINDRLVEFLGITGTHKEIFHNHYENAKAHSSKSRAMRYLKPVVIELNELSPNLTHKQKINKQAKMPLFKSYCSHYQKNFYADHYEYIFVVRDENDPRSESWKICKTYKEFKTFHEQLEGVMGREISTFDTLVPKAVSQQQTGDIGFIEARRDGLEKYMDAITGHRQYYKELLYDFLEYDRGQNTSQNSIKSISPRASFYGENT